MERPNAGAAIHVSTGTCQWRRQDAHSHFTCQVQVLCVFGAVFRIHQVGSTHTYSHTTHMLDQLICRLVSLLHCWKHLKFPGLYCYKKILKINNRINTTWNKLKELAMQMLFSENNLKRFFVKRVCGRGLGLEEFMLYHRHSHPHKYGQFIIAHFIIRHVK